MMKTRRIALALAIILVGALVVFMLYQIEGSGLPDYGDPTKANFTRGKTLWDWMQLLIVPAMLAGAAVWFNNQTRQRDESSKEDRFREEALQKYFDDMIELLLRQPIPNTESLERTRHVAASRTIVVLHRLDHPRIQEMLVFLREAGWLSGEASILRNAALIAETKLRDVDLKLADLSEADLSGANLSDSDLSLATLRGTILNGANLSRVDFTGADLSNCNLRLADLTEAELNGANLTGADLRGAGLNGARLDSNLILPDGTHWTPETNMRRFTNSF